MWLWRLRELRGANPRKTRRPAQSYFLTPHNGKAWTRADAIARDAYHVRASVNLGAPSVSSVSAVQRAQISNLLYNTKYLTE
jgi:hypothetical protein